ncbi:MAG: rhodanese-like domain-containing protein [Thermodesulfobacteriota bacterium]
MSILAAGAAGAFAKDMFEEEVDKDALSVKLARETVQGGYELVTAAELKKMMDEKKPMLVIDTMPFEGSFKKAHVPGAVSFEFPIEPMEAWDEAKTGGKAEKDFEKLLGPDKNRLLVFYCGFVKCTRSHNGALWARKLGYSNIVRFPGGIYAWQGAKYPVDAVK